MRRREFIAGLGGAAAWPVVAGAQSDRVAKVGILAYGNKPNSPVIEAFRSELGTLGYIEGGNLAIEFRGPANDPSRIDNLASELVLASVDVIVTDGLPSALAAKKAGPVGNRDEFAAVFEKFKAQRVSAVATVAEAMLFQERQRIVDLALASRLPGMYPDRPFADAGGLLFYGPLVVDLFKRAAGHVDRILKGAKVGDLPIEQPTHFEFVVNFKTAKALGLKVPPSLLARADEVIE